MSISVTKKQENFSPLKWAALGAATGCVVRDLHPITDAEKKYFEYDKFLLDRKKSVRETVDEEIKILRNTVKLPNLGYDTYEKFVYPPKSKAEREKFLKEFYDKLPEDAKNTFNNLRNHVDKRVREVKKHHDFVFEALIKKGRPLFNYAFIGGLIATGAAFVTHVISKMSNSAKS